VTRLLGIALAGGIVALGCGGEAGAESVAEFYRTHSLSIVIGVTVANGYDSYGRAVGRHIGKHIPGNPTVVPLNKPGAGSLTAANYIYSVAPKDGSVIGIFNRSVAVAPLLGTPGALFDARKFTWIGSGGNEVSLCVAWHTAAVKTWDDLMANDFVVGTAGPGSDSGVYSQLIKTLFAPKMKIINGYPGGAELEKAIETGEIDGRCGWSFDAAKASQPSWFSEKKINVLVQLGLHKSKELPDVPLIVDLGKTHEQRQMLKFVFSRQEIGWPFTAPPDIPEDRKLALRQAFEETLRDPEFLDDARKLGLDVNLITGPAVENLIDEIYRTPADVVAKVRSLLTPQ
jgi:tripartite-type tricarboxylate transporter receptor subunit TctC